MSHYDNAERDYEESDNTVSYALSFVEGQDTVRVEVSYPSLPDGEIQMDLTDPALIAALHAACEPLIHDYFKAQDEQREHERTAALGEYLDILSQGI